MKSEAYLGGVGGLGEGGRVGGFPPRADLHFVSR